MQKSSARTAGAVVNIRANETIAAAEAANVFEVAVICLLSVSVPQKTVRQAIGAEPHTAHLGAEPRPAIAGGRIAGIPGTTVKIRCPDQLSRPREASSRRHPAARMSRNKPPDDGRQIALLLDVWQLAGADG